MFVVQAHLLQLISRKGVPFLGTFGCVCVPLVYTLHLLRDTGFLERMA